jgi:hypothetical protein
MPLKKTGFQQTILTFSTLGSGVLGPINFKEMYDATIISVSTVRSIAAYLLVGILWGCTNPFIKQAQSLIVTTSATRPPTEKSTKFNIFATICSQVTNLCVLLSDRRIFFPYAINQSGSLVSKMS